MEEELAVVRRHEGRLRIDSERLHKWEKDPKRWVGKTTFMVDLPLPIREEPAKKGNEAASAPVSPHEGEPAGASPAGSAAQEGG